MIESRLHVECMYGFYHGQDPRTFTPDNESCSDKEIQTHKELCAAWDRGERPPDNSGCFRAQIGSSSAIVCSTFCGIGTYHVVLTDEGEYVRDATMQDLERAQTWTEVLDEDGGAPELGYQEDR